MLTELAREELRRAALDRPSAVTLGVFDGVHLGHQALVAELIRQARKRGYGSVVLSFHPAPITVLRPEVRVRYISTLEERLALLRSLGVDEVASLTFTSDLAQVSAQDFIAGLRQQLDMRLLVGGPDQAVGRAREGDLPWLHAHGPALGFEVETVGFSQEDGRKMGSSWIRAALAEGDVEAARRLLGRPFALHGPVVGGARRGRTIGFPTANIAIAPDLAVPAFGVYVTRAFIESGAPLPAVTNIGRRPTFDDGSPSIETHVLDFDGDLYGRELRIELLARLRGEQKFDGIESLVAQIQRDVAAARAYLTAAPPAP